MRDVNPRTAMTPPRLQGCRYSLPRAAHYRSAERTPQGVDQHLIGRLIGRVLALLEGCDERKESSVFLGVSRVHREQFAQERSFVDHHEWG